MFLFNKLNFKTFLSENFFPNYIMSFDLLWGWWKLFPLLSLLHCCSIISLFGEKKAFMLQTQIEGKKNERFNIISILFYWSSSYQSLIFVFINFICRKGLVDIFDKLEAGQLKEGSSLSYLVTQMHKNRWLYCNLFHKVC